MASKVREAGTGKRAAGKSRIPKASFEAIATSEGAPQPVLCAGCYKHPCECLSAGAPCDPEVEQFRERFDLDKLGKGLGHTPNAMAGAIVDAAKSQRDAAAGETNGRKHESNGHKRESNRAKPGTKAAAVAPRPIPRAPDAGCDPSELFERTPCFLLPLSSILPDPKNARKTFDPAKLESLAAGMKKRGQRTPCKVRPVGAGRYMLIDGERRFRAAKIARLSQLRCEIEDVTDEEAREDALVTNLQREDLNPIERAIGYKQLLDDGRTQQGVADLLGLSGQAAVSNAVRLLELPDAIKDRVASGQIESTVATSLVPHCRRPAFVEAFLDVAKDEKWDFGVRELPVLLREAAGKSGYKIPFYPEEKLNFARKHEAEVDLVQIEHDWFVFNKSAWNKLRAEKSKKEQAKAGNKKKAPRSYHDDWKARQEAENRAAAYTRAVAQGLLEWLVPQLVAFAETQPATAPFCAQYILHKALNTGGLGDAYNDTWGDTLVKAAKSTGLNVKWRAAHACATKLERLREISAREFDAVAKTLVLMDLQAMLKGSGFEYLPLGYFPEVAILAHAAGVAWERDWKPTREFLELHDAKQLTALIKEWGVKLGDVGALPASELVDALLAAAENRRLSAPEIICRVLKGK